MGFNNINNNYFADFETTSKENFMVEEEVRVFMWRVENIHGRGEEGTDIESFIHYLRRISHKRQINIWFHNLKFDFSFIESHFLRNDIVSFTNGKYETQDIWDKENDTVTIKTFKPAFASRGNQYTTIRDDMNNLYGATWFVDNQRKKENGNRSQVRFMDSAKIFPMSLESMGEMLDLEKLSETYDYEVHRPEFYQPTETEWNYIRMDTKILRMAMQQQFDKSSTIRHTRSSYAFARLKETFNNQNTPENWNQIKMENNYNNRITYFDHCFPASSPNLYNDLQKSYSGGIVYVNNKYRNQLLDKLNSFDVNSEYPAAMVKYDFPIGHEQEFDGLYFFLNDELKEEYPLFVQQFTCEFKLKEDGFPMLPKHLSKNGKTITSSDQLKGTKVMALAKPDYEHFLKNYDIDKKTLKFFGGYMWKSTHAPFKDFIEMVNQEKVSAEESGNMFNRQMAKLDMNGCYGKFAQSPFRESKITELDKDEILRYRDDEEEPEAKQYFPMAIFITAYARDILLNGVYDIGVEKVLYIDTDSIHVFGQEIPEKLEIHPTKLGSWDEEGPYEQGIFLRDKFYGESKINQESGELELILKGAGISEDAKGRIVQLDDYKLNRYYVGGLQARQVKGGTLLVDIEKYVSIDEELETESERLRRIEYEEQKKQRKIDREEQHKKEVKELKKRLNKEKALVE